MKPILLGMFRTKTFNQHLLTHSCYPFSELYETGDPRIEWYNWDILGNVGNACNETNNITFILDELDPNHPLIGVTSEELTLILNNPQWWYKVEFRVDNQLMCVEEVISKYGKHLNNRLNEVI